MDNIPFHIVDVFAEKKYEGNQLAIFVDLENQLSTQAMQKIATEINFAESSFIKTILDHQKYGVRIFTPEYEVPFAGHPCLGTAYIISRFMTHELTNHITLKLSQLDIPITIRDPSNIDSSLFSMRQTQPLFRNIFTIEEISDGLGIKNTDIDNSFPIQEISTGLPYIICPLQNLKAIGNLALKPKSLLEFLLKHKLHKSNSRDGLSTSLFFYSSETFEVDSDFNTRMFVLENERIVEDAATGSANGCFLAYLLKYNRVKIKAKIEQGFQMKRKSYIYLEGEEAENQFEINVGGKVQYIASGNWSI